jgi:hypothetical protein
MKSFVLSLYVLILTFTLNAQSGQLNGMLDNRPYTDLFRRMRMNSDRPLRGTPFWKSTWEKGIFVFKDNSLLKNIPVKILFYEEQSVLAKRPEGDSIIINMEKIKELRIYDPNIQDTVRFQRIVHSENVKGEIMEVLYEGQTSLYIRHEVTFVAGEPPRAMGTGRTYDEFASKVDYYVVKKGYPVLKKFRPNKKGILEALPGQDVALTEYLKTQKLDLGNNKDLVKIVAYYNQLEGDKK